MRGIHCKGGISLVLHISGSAVSTATPLSSCISFSNTVIHSAPLPAGKITLGMAKEDIVFLQTVVSLLAGKSDIHTPPLVLPVNKKAAKMISSYDLLQGVGLCKQIGFEEVYVAR